MKVIILAALAAAVGIPVSLAAHQTDNAIVVQTDPAVAQWSTKMGSRLGHNLAALQASGEGVALVRFQCSDKGRPSSVKLFQKSGSNQVDRAAMRAVSNLRGMHPLPSGIGEDQIYEAAIVVSGSPRGVDGHIKQLQLARAKTAPDPRVLAFVVAPGRSPQRLQE